MAEIRFIYSIKYFMEHFPWPCVELRARETGGNKTVMFPTLREFALGSRGPHPTFTIQPGKCCHGNQGRFTRRNAL